MRVVKHWSEGTVSCYKCGKKQQTMECFDTNELMFVTYCTKCRNNREMGDKNEN